MVWFWLVRSGGEGGDGVIDGYKDCNGDDTSQGKTGGRELPSC